MQVQVGVEYGHGGRLEEEDELDPDQMSQGEVMVDPVDNGLGPEPRLAAAPHGGGGVVVVVGDLLDFVVDGGGLGGGGGHAVAGLQVFVGAEVQAAVLLQGQIFTHLALVFCVKKCIDSCRYRMQDYQIAE